MTSCGWTRRFGAALGTAVLALAAHASALDEELVAKVKAAYSEQEDTTTALALLDSVPMDQREDPEWYILRANALFNGSRSAYVELDGEAMEMRQTIEYDDAMVARAIRTLEDAETRWPDRLDIPFGIMQIHAARSDCAKVLPVARRAISTAKRLGPDARWADGKPVPGDPDAFFADVCHQHIRILLTETDGKKQIPCSAAALQLAELAAENYPKDPRLLNLQGYAHIQLGSKERGLAVIRKAAELAPDDGLLGLNVAILLAELERFEEADLQFEKVLKMENLKPEFRADVLERRDLMMKIWRSQTR